MTVALFSVDAELLTRYDIENLITESLSLFAANDFAIYVGLTYNIDGVETTDLLDYNSTLSDLRVPEKEGYTFKGWFYDEECKVAVKSTDKLTKNTTIYAKFTANPKTTFWSRVGHFFAKWGWLLILVSAVIAAVIIIAILFVKKRQG